MKRCNWKNLLSNDLYIEYHYNEWGIESHDDNYLFEMILLESFHCGLSWLIILKKREAFRKAFDNFDYNIICNYKEKDILRLLDNKEIVRHRGKIEANIKNAKAFIKVREEFKTFNNYIWSFTNNKIIYNIDANIQNKTELSDIVSKDLKKRGFKFLGSVTTQSFLEAIGVFNNHQVDCFKHVKQNVINK